MRRVYMSVARRPQRPVQPEQAQAVATDVAREIAKAGYPAPMRLVNDAWDRARSEGWRVDPLWRVSAWGMGAATDPAGVETTVRAHEKEVSEVIRLYESQGLSVNVRSAASLAASHLNTTKTEWVKARFDPGDEIVDRVNRASDVANKITGEAIGANLKSATWASIKGFGEGLVEGASNIISFASDVVSVVPAAAKGAAGTLAALPWIIGSVAVVGVAAYVLSRRRSTA